MISREARTEIVTVVEKVLGEGVRKVDTSDDCRQK